MRLNNGPGAWRAKKKEEPRISGTRYQLAAAEQEQEHGQHDAGDQVE